MFENEYDTEDDIPSEVRHLFVEDGDKFILIPVSKMASQDNVRRLEDGIRKERDSHKKTKEKLRAFGDLDPEDVHDKLDKWDDLEARASRKSDDDIDELVEKRLASRLKPLERENKTLKETNDLLTEENTKFQKDTVVRTIQEQTRQAAKKAKLNDFGIEDAVFMATHIMTQDEDGEFVTKENPYGIDTGLSVSEWLPAMEERRPLWWEETVPGNSTGNKRLKSMANNPFSKDHWNVTKQGQLVRDNETKAAQMAAQAGTKIGGPKPT